MECIVDNRVRIDDLLDLRGVDFSRRRQQGGDEFNGLVLLRKGVEEGNIVLSQQFTSLKEAPAGAVVAAAAVNVNGDGMRPSLSLFAALVLGLIIVEMVLVLAVSLQITAIERVRDNSECALLQLHLQEGHRRALRVKQQQRAKVGHHISVLIRHRRVRLQLLIKRPNVLVGEDEALPGANDAGVERLAALAAPKDLALLDKLGPFAILVVVPLEKKRYGVEQYEPHLSRPLNAQLVIRRDINGVAGHVVIVLDQQLTHRDAKGCLRENVVGEHLGHARGLHGGVEVGGADAEILNVEEHIVAIVRRLDAFGVQH